MVDELDLKTWDQLVRLAHSLKPGEAIVISRGAIRSCARGVLDSAFDSVRDSDIARLIEFIESMGNVALWEDHRTGDFRLSKSSLKVGENHV